MIRLIKLCATVVCFSSVFAVLPVIAKDVRTNEVDGVVWQYTVTDGKASLGLGKYSWTGRAIIGTPPANLTIPNEINGYPIVEIADYGLWDLSFESVTIPEGVTRIGRYAFGSCSALKKVVIPASVSIIDSRYGWPPFSGCTSLEEVEFKGNRDNIDMVVTEAFRGTPWLEKQEFSLEIKDNEVLGFLGVCPETVIIPDGVTWISYNAFQASSVTNLVHLSLPSSLISIGNQDFVMCSRLTEVTFGREDWFDYYNMEAFCGTPFGNTLPFEFIYEWLDYEGDEGWYITGYIGKCPENLDIGAEWAKIWGEDSQSEQTLAGIRKLVFAYSDISSVTFPEMPIDIGDYAFSDCTNLTRIVFLGDAPKTIKENAFVIHRDVFDEWGMHIGGESVPNTNCTVYVPKNSEGWGVDIPGKWMGMSIRYSVFSLVEDGVLKSVELGGDTEYTIPLGVTNIAANAFAGCGDLERVVISDEVVSIDRTAFDECGKLWAKWYKTLSAGVVDAPSASISSELALTVTNVVVHYVTQSVKSEAVIPPMATGIVNIISEINTGNALAIPQEWGGQYPSFESKFGSDFTKAIVKQTGKYDGGGKPMMVWQDFVAGTDPTNPDDVFTASITFDAVTKAPIISWTPELSQEEAAKRIYKTFGKERITDTEWKLINGDATKYNFFKVTVEMK